MSEGIHSARAGMAGEAMPEIDAGIRRWYASCRCCLSDAHPEVVAVLDAERDAVNEARAEAGICEVAETEEAAPAPPIARQKEVVTMAKILDPVCDMVVDVDAQRAKGLTSEHAGKTYAFCGPGCKRGFDKDPSKYTAKVATWESSGGSGGHAGHHG